MKRGEHSPESIKRRKTLNRHKKRYMELREELMLAGEIPTEPAGAIRDERVPPDSQGSQPQPGLIEAAIRHGWAVPEDKKPRLVDELISVLDDPEAKQKDKVAAYSALLRGDQHQYEVDHPQDNNRPGAAVININVETVAAQPSDVAPVEMLDAVEAIKLVEVSADDAGDKQDHQGPP